MLVWLTLATGAQANNAAPVIESERRARLTRLAYVIKSQRDDGRYRLNDHDTERYDQRTKHPCDSHKQQETCRYVEAPFGVMDHKCPYQPCCEKRVIDALVDRHLGGGAV